MGDPLKATDPDDGDTLKFYVMSVSLPGGAPVTGMGSSGLFGITEPPTSGQLETLATRRGVYERHLPLSVLFRVSESVRGSHSE